MVPSAAATELPYEVVVPYSNVTFEDKRLGFTAPFNTAPEELIPVA